MYRWGIVGIAVLALVFCFTSLTAQNRYKINKLGINSAASDFSAVFFKDGIVFCSERRNDTIRQITLSAQNLTDIYYAERNDAGSFGTAEILSAKLLSAFHDGPASFTADEKQIWFSRNLEQYMDPNNPDEDLVIGLFHGNYVGGQWDNIQPFPYNSADYSLACPSVSKDGKTLYFTSDMPGGQGQSDVYVSKWSNGEWSKPENLGTTVNSAKSETFAFIHPSGRLYFASDGHGSMGGLDVFYCDPVDSGWTKPVNLGAPINSRADDFAFVTDASNEHGFVSSNRKFIDHIYGVELNFPSFKSPLTQESSSTCVTFFEEGTAAMKESPLQYKWNLGDGTEIEGDEAEHCYNGAGVYEVKLSVFDTLTGKTMQNVASFEYEVKADQDLWLSNRPGDNSSQVFRGHFNADNLGSLLELYWDFGDGHRAIGPNPTHEYEKPGEYDVVLGALYKNAKGKTAKIAVTKTVIVK